jgi:carbonic anhydrase
MKRLTFYILLFISLFPLTILANTTSKILPTKEVVKNLYDLLEQNKSYITQQGPDFFTKKSKGQHPQITLVSCSDSRVHTSIIDDTPEGNLFTINNIANQISVAQGSVEYGVNYLHTPLLLILGHSQCGAIEAASSDYSQIEPSIKKELDSIHLKPGESNIEGVQTNVNNQVVMALKVFKSQVQRGDLVIVGAVYDFANDMKQGAGKLNIINVQGKIIKNNKL